MSDLIRRDHTTAVLDLLVKAADATGFPVMADGFRGAMEIVAELPAVTVQAQIDEVQPDLLEAACIAAHNAYEQAAHEAGWVTNTQSRKPWVDVPEANKIAMRAGIAAAIRKGTSHE
jgi:hypothetical protein